MKFPTNMPGEELINSWYPILFSIVVGVIYWIRSYFKGGQCRSRLTLDNKCAIVTGANSGIGREIAMDLALRGARVIMACRNLEDAEETCKTIKQQSRNKNVKVMKLDLSSFSSIREFAEDFLKSETKLHILFNNAGVMCHPYAKTEDGFEIQFGVNHLGHFLLTHLLLDMLKSSKPSRIINNTAPAYQIGEINFDDINFEKTENEYKPGIGYAQSKLAVLLCTTHLSKILDGSGVCVNVVNPGVVNSSAHRHMPFKQNFLIRWTFAPFAWFFMKSAKDGAQASLQAGVAEEEADVSGKLYRDCRIVEMSENAKDESVAEKLYELSMKLVKLQ